MAIKKANLKLTSAMEPTLSARGSVMRLGTKNRGNHFASSADPGLKISYNSLPLGASKNVANRAPHPASAEGNPIEKACKSRRQKMSNAMSIDAATRDFFNVVGAGPVASSSSTALDESNAIELKRPIEFGFATRRGAKHEGLCCVATRRKGKAFGWKAKTELAKTTRTATIKLRLVDDMSANLI